MIIEKILNNNVVITKDGNGNEVIAMGRGLAFQKRNGQTIRQCQVDKMYRLASDDLSERLQDQLLDIPVEYLTITDKIIDYSKETLGVALNDSIYVSLTDHIHTAVKRMRQGFPVNNVLLWDIRRFYPKEFQIGMKVIEKLKEYHQIELPEDEAGFIAMHLVNAQAGNENLGKMFELTMIMQDILYIVKDFFEFVPDEDSTYFSRFTTHLRFFLTRLLAGNAAADETDEVLLEALQRKNQQTSQCVDKIAEFLEEQHEHVVTDDERLYLIIHIARLVGEKE